MCLAMFCHVDTIVAVISHARVYDSSDERDTGCRETIPFANVAGHNKRDATPLAGLRRGRCCSQKQEQKERRWFAWWITELKRVCCAGQFSGW